MEAIGAAASIIGIVTAVKDVIDLAVKIKESLEQVKSDLTCMYVIFPSFNRVLFVCFTRSNRMPQNTYESRIVLLIVLKV